jgi:hypothetical protein
MNKPLHSTVKLDFQRAYDSVYHHAVRRAMVAFGIPQPLINVVMDYLKSVTMTVRLGNQYTDPIPVRRGLPQGDPTSPILFIMVVNEVLLPENFAASCSPTAYADDQLISGPIDGLQRTLTHWVAILKELGITLNRVKCRLFNGAQSETIYLEGHILRNEGWLRNPHFWLSLQF